MAVPWQIHPVARRAPKSQHCALDPLFFFLELVLDELLDVESALRHQRQAPVCSPSLNSQLPWSLAG